jgi:hypothetical protein
MQAHVRKRNRGKPFGKPDLAPKSVRGEATFLHSDPRFFVKKHSVQKLLPLPPAEPRPSSSDPHALDARTQSVPPNL